MTLQETWAPVVQAALDEYLSRKSGVESMAVPVAPLKPLVMRYAEQMGFVFPPQGYERLKFVDFLDFFPSVIRIRRRPGQDALVVRAANADLLDHLVLEKSTSVTKREVVAFRSDVFNAFTKILPSEQCYWYSIESDEFSIDGANASQQSFVRVPSLTLEEAISERRDFAGTAIANRDALLDALGTPTAPLGAFSRVVKELHLERAWHVFRVERLVQKIDAWTKFAGIERNPAWESGVRSVKSESDTITARETNAFLAGLMQLGPEDAKRIMVPLDIVLKLIRRD